MVFSIPGGQVRVEADGLYWQITAECRAEGARAPRLYLGGEKLGTFMPAADGWGFSRRISRRSCPIDRESVFTLTDEARLWAYDPDRPLPQMERFRQLIPEMRGGQLYLHLPEDCARIPSDFKLRRNAEREPDAP